MKEEKSKVLFVDQNSDNNSDNNSENKPKSIEQDDNQSINKSINVVRGSLRSIMLECCTYQTSILTPFIRFLLSQNYFKCSWCG